MHTIWPHIVLAGPHAEGDGAKSGSQHCALAPPPPPPYPDRNGLEHARREDYGARDEEHEDCVVV